MKYYKELSDIETESIRLEVVTSLVRAINSGHPDLTRDELSNCLHHIEDQLLDINSQLVEKFNLLWATVRDDSIKEDKPKTKSKKK